MLPNYADEILTVEKSLNLAKKRMLQSMNAHYKEFDQPISFDDPTNGGIDRSIQYVTDILYNDTMIMNNMDTMIYFGNLGRNQGQGYRFLDPKAYYDYMSNLNKLIFNLEKINKIVEKALPYIGYASNSLIDRFNVVSKEFHNTFIFIKREAFGDNNVFRIQQVNMKIDTNITRERWVILTGKKVLFEKLYESVITNYNAMQKKKQSMATRG